MHAWGSSKDAYIGSSQHLRDHLVNEILQREITERRLNQLPTEAALPQQVVRNLGQLGTVDESRSRSTRAAVASV